MTALNPATAPDPFVDQRLHPRVTVALPAFLIWRRVRPLEGGGRGH